MEQSPLYFCGEATSSFFGRLSSIPAVASRPVMRSYRIKYPARLGDHRQLQDLARRDESESQPLIGPEGLHAMKQTDWRAATLEIYRTWGSIRGFMIQQCLCGLDTTSEDLREHLCRLLCRVEQISAQG